MSKFTGLREGGQASWHGKEERGEGNRKRESLLARREREGRRDLGYQNVWFI